MITVLYALRTIKFCKTYAGDVWTNLACCLQRSFGSKLALFVPNSQLLLYSMMVLSVFSYIRKSFTTHNVETANRFHRLNLTIYLIFKYSLK